VSKMSAEEAAGLIVGIRRRYRRHYRLVREGKQSTLLRREVTNARKALANLLNILDCPPRATWTALLAHYEILEARLEAAVGAGGRATVSSAGRRLTPD
jgi:hypothetical protein